MYEGALTEHLADEFEALFTKGDGIALDIGTLAGGQPIDTILMDCLMYDDDGVFEGALNLLSRRYGQRKKLLDSISNVMLLNEPVIPIFSDIAQLQADLGLLRYSLRSTEVWAVKSRVSGDFDLEIYATVTVRHGQDLLHLMHQRTPSSHSRARRRKPCGR